jgi:hypothetical protein
MTPDGWNSISIVPDAASIPCTGKQSRLSGDLFEKILLTKGSLAGRIENPSGDARLNYTGQ